MNQDINAVMNEYLPLRDVVFNTLRQAILKGELKPGERLMEIQLANRLGVSRTPVREAIRKLELEGLVLMIPRKGAVVAEITIKDLEDVLEVRGVLEILAVQNACQNITEIQLQELKNAAHGEKAQQLRRHERYHIRHCDRSPVRIGKRCMAANRRFGCFPCSSIRRRKAFVHIRENIAF